MNSHQKEIESEIENYKPKSVICKLMRDLSDIGFGFSGHGVGFDGEDFNLIKKATYVNIHVSSRGKVSVNIIKNTDGSLLFAGNPKNAMEYLTGFVFEKGAKG